MSVRLTQTSPDDDFEFVLTQYLDGALCEADATRVEERLATDASARKTLAEYEKLDAHFAALPEMPAVDWDAFGASVRLGLNELPLPVLDEAEDLAGVTPSLRLTFAPYRACFAVAATLLVAATIAIVYRAEAPGGTRSPAAVGGTAGGVAVVAGPALPTSNLPAVAQIEVGPSPQLSRSHDAGRYGVEDLLSRPSRMDISGFDGAAGPGVFEDGRVY